MPRSVWCHDDGEHVISSDTHAIAAGDEHSVVLKQDGSVWVTGRNNAGQLGDGQDKSYRTTFVQVIASGMQAVAAGGSHSMVLKIDGGLWATGSNSYGQLGVGTATDQSVFVRVMALRGGGTWCSAGNVYNIQYTGNTFLGIHSFEFAVFI